MVVPVVPVTIIPFATKSLHARLISLNKAACGLDNNNGKVCCERKLMVVGLLFQVRML